MSNKKRTQLSTQDVDLLVPALKVKRIEAEIRDLNYKIIANKVTLQGVIHKQIFYVGIDNIVHHQSDDMPFSAFVDVAGAEPGMLAQIDIDIEKIIHHLEQEGTVLVQKAILQIFVKVFEEEIVEIALDDTGPLVELEELIAEKEETFVIESTRELDPVGIQIEEIRTDVNIVDVVIEEDELIVFGVIEKQVFYLDETDTIVHITELVPFDESLEIIGIDAGMDAVISADIVDIQPELREDGTILFQELILQIEAIIIQIVQQSIAEGLGPLVKLPIVIGEDTTQILKSNIVDLQEEAQSVDEIVGEIVEISGKVIEDKVLVQGTINKEISYTNLNGLVNTQTETVSFSTFVDIEGAEINQELRVSGEIEDIDFNLVNATAINQDITIEIFVKVVEMNQLNIEIGEDLEVLLPLVIGENTKQILVEQEEIIIPPVDPLIIEFITIALREEVDICEQSIIDEIVDLERVAIKVKGIEATVENIATELVLDDLLIVTGIVNKDISYVGEDNIVYHQKEEIPFLIELNLPEPLESDEIEVIVTIETIKFNLLPGGEQLRQVIVLKACLQADTITFLTMVTFIEGPGISISTAQLQEEVVIATDPLVTEKQIFPVVTDIDDPEGQLTTITKETHLLNVLDVGRIPLEVVVFAE